MEIDGVAHPLSAVYHRRVLPDLETLLARDQRRLTALLDALATRRVRPDEVAAADPGLLALENVNTPAEYREALSRAGLT